MSVEGSTIGAYRVLRVLGKGGMGAVYVGEHTLLGRMAAIKVLLPALSSDTAIVQRFFNEAKAATQIADPGIVQVFDFGFTEAGTAYIIMELLEGQTLAARLQGVGRMTPFDVVRLVRMMCISLGAAHSRGIVHRDLKPENVFLVTDAAVTGGERAKILDFGIAKLSRDEGTSVTQVGALMGTPLYMSPEQCQGAKDIDHRSDIYSLGCVVLSMLTGAPPFEHAGSGELIVAHLTTPPPRASSRVQGIPPAIDAIVDRCLAKDPDQRFQTMGELAQELAAIEEQFQYARLTPPAGVVVVSPRGAPPPSFSGVTQGTGIGASAPAPTAVPQPSGKRRGLLIAGIAGVAIAAGLVVASQGSGGSSATGSAGSGSAVAATASAGATPTSQVSAPVDAAAAPVDAAATPDAAAIVDATHAATPPTPPTPAHKTPVHHTSNKDSIQSPKHETSPTPHFDRGD